MENTSYEKNMGLMKRYAPFRRKPKGRIFLPSGVPIVESYTVFL